MYKNAFLRDFPNVCTKAYVPNLYLLFLLKPKQGAENTLLFAVHID